MGQFDYAVAAIKLCWGGMIELGGTTFWEIYSPEWNRFMAPHAVDAVPNGQNGFTSMCHPWSSGVTYWMTETLLGIKPIVPGFAEFEVVPKLLPTLLKLSGKVATPRGNISMSFNYESGIAHVTAFTDAVYRVGFSKTARPISSIRQGTQVVWSTSASAGMDVQETESFIYVFNLRGAHSFEINFLDTASRAIVAPSFIFPGPFPPFPPPYYPSELQGTDVYTQGNWIGVYGSKGYVLCAYGNDDTNVQQLPPGYSIVNSYNEAQLGSYGPTGSNPANSTLAPQNPSGGPRNVGCYYGSPTFSLDIIFEGEEEFTLTMYFIDWDHRNRQQIVSLMDFQTRNVIAPTQFLPDFTSGVYLVYTYNRAVRVRVSNVRGDNAVLTALFFD
jgi:alpha-L-rhamnosidase